MTQLDRIRVARGGKRPSTEAEWSQYEADKKARRAKNVVNAKECLDRNGVVYKDHGGRERLFTLSKGNEFIFYMPETGRWWVETTDKKALRFGVRNLVLFINGVLK